MFKRVVLLLLVIIATWSIVGMGQASPSQNGTKPLMVDTIKYQPTEIQLLKLQVKQRDAQLAQRDLQTAQTKFQQSILDLTNEAEVIKKENKWDEKVTFDPNTISFSEPPKKEEKKEPAKP